MTGSRAKQEIVKFAGPLHLAVLFASGWGFCPLRQLRNPLKWPFQAWSVSDSCFQRLRLASVSSAPLRRRYGSSSLLTIWSI